MEKKDILELNDEDCKKIVAETNALNFSQIVKKSTKKNYIEKNKFALFNVVSIIQGDPVITSERASIGYILPNNKIYDFISNNLYDICTLYQMANIDEDSQYALISDIIYKDSKDIIYLKSSNMNKISELLISYVNEYKNDEFSLKQYHEGINDTEHIPEFRKLLTRY